MITNLTAYGKAVVIESHKDHIGGVIEATGAFYENEMLVFIKDNVKGGGAFVDVGANIGNHTLFFAMFCADHVYSFEPVAQNLEILRRNVVGNSLSEMVSIYPFAVCSTSKNFSAAINHDNMGMCKMVRGKGIKSIRIDDVPFKERVSLIKIDCEGMDLDVLESAKILIKKDSPAIFIEADRITELEQIGSFLGELGYSIAGRFNATPTWYFKKEKSQ